MTLVKDSWAALRRYTPARVGLGRTGVSLPTARHLELQEALALARNAVHADFEPAAISAELRALELESVMCESAAPNRETYLRRPDLGRRLSPASRATLELLQGSPVDLALVVADGLSAAATKSQSAALLGALRDLLPTASWRFSPVVLVRQGRVAVGDEVAALLGARAVVVLIGERPGLSAADSLGAYVTWAPRVGCRDSERNCISNIRAEGLSIADGARGLAALLSAARAHQRTGVALSQLLAGQPSISGAVPSGR
ncbi:MAG: ethanolamine ammonia-lyase subunit EutC [Myxococcaceae bacterium]